MQNVEYSIAIDGVAGGAGYFVLSWALDAASPGVPVILAQPQDIAVAPGSVATFSVLATGPGLFYQWLFNDTPIDGANGPTFSVINAKLSDVGTYSVRVANASAQVLSSSANLELASQPGLVTRDKFADVASSVPGPGLPGFVRISAPASLAVTPISFGLPGFQDFANTHSGSDPVDPALCAVGGSSRWLVFTPSATGLMAIDTMGTPTNLPTIIAVFAGSTVADIIPSKLVACDVNSAPDGHSLVRFQAQGGSAYSVLIDGTNGVTGKIHLNYCLGLAPAVVAGSTTPVFREGTTLSVSAEVSAATPPAAYQWYRNGLLISGATQSSYNLVDLPANSAGVYSMVASNCLGMSSNIVARVTVEVPLTMNFLALETAGHLDFHVTGAASRGFMIQASSNFLNWIPIYTNPTPFTPVNFADPFSATQPRRFYRAMPWGP